MKAKIFKFWLIIVLIVASWIPIIEAPVITVSPENTEDDAFRTGIGAYFGDTPFLPLRDSTQNIVIGTRFRNVTIPQGTKINNATLFVRTIYGYDAANNITVTITGDDSDDSAPFNDSGSFSRTYTLAYEIWDISEVNGNQWNNVTVTGIVQEIIDRIGWNSGNSLSLIMFTDQGTPRREFVSVDGNPTFTAYLNITYGEIPTTPQEEADPPYNNTDFWTWVFNRTYRGIDIWTVWNENKTGFSANVNWNLLNQTLLTEIDSGAAITVNNATWTSISAMQSQQVDCLYNDTGSAGVNSYFVRFAVNISNVFNGLGGGSDTVVTLASLSTATPVGGGGLAWGGAGDWVGVFLYVNVDNERYSIRLAERSGVAMQHAPAGTGWFYEGINQILYITFYYKTGSVVPDDWTKLSVYSDPDFSNLIHTSTQILAWAAPPFRYPQIIASLDTGLSFLSLADYFTFSTALDSDGDTFLSYPNGTLVDPDPLPPDADPEESIDELLGGAQPEDPETEAYGSIGKFRWKLLVMAVGFIMLLGSPIAGIHFGASPASWIKLLFVMCFGLAILSSLKFM